MNVKKWPHDSYGYLVSQANIPTTTLDSYINKQFKNMTPYIIEERPVNITTLDVFSRLLMDNIIFLGMPINEDVANIIVAQILFLENAKGSEEEIKIFINSPGGSVYDGYSIYDVMQYSPVPIHTICTGMAASMAAVILAAGESGYRSALKHSRIMIHQPMGGASGQASDMEIAVTEINKVKQEIYQILSHHTGQSTETIEQDSDRDKWMSSEEALNYGIIDVINLKRETK